MSPNGRVLAIGDIHGCSVALSRLVATIGVQSSDTLVVLGDVVDRGPGSRDVVDQLLELRARCRLLLIQGNHEEMMLQALGSGEGDNWLPYGGHETLMSYGGGLEAVPESHREFLGSGLPFWETEDLIFVHANLEPGVPLVDQRPVWLRWTHLTGHESPHPSGKRVVCGHTPQSSGLPLVADGWLCLDTLCWAGGFLTCADLGSEEIWQARESGAVRAGRSLSDLS